MVGEMKTHRFRLAAAVGAVAALAVAVVAIAAANGGGHGIKEKLTGYQENPALSTTGHGKFRLSIDRKAQEIHYTLTYGRLESDATQSHIHSRSRRTTAASSSSCARTSATGRRVRRRARRAAERSAGRFARPTSLPWQRAQGIAAGEFDELVAAITYVNIHSVNRPGGEIRAQLVHGNHGKDKRH
jgi:CHRD domain